MTFRIEKLPREIALDIFSRLPIQSLIISKNVCRDWRRMIADSCLVALFQERSNERDPNLIIHCDFPTFNTISYRQGYQTSFSTQAWSETIHSWFLQWVQLFIFVVLGGCLSAAMCQEDRGIEIWVMREYDVLESWSKDYVIANFQPVQQTPYVLPQSDVWCPRLRRGVVQIICLLHNDKILLQYESAALVLYDHEVEEFKELVISGLPNWFGAIIHRDSILPAEVALLGDHNVN